MKIKGLFLRPHHPQCSAVGGFLAFLAVAVVLWSEAAAGQHPAIPKLTLSQVEELVSHGVPDSTMSTQIQRRGLAFAPTPAIVESLRVKGAGPQTLAAIEALFPKAAPSTQTSTATTGAKNGGSKRHTPVATHVQVRRGKVEVHTEPGSQLLLDGKEVGNAGADGLLVLQDVTEGDHELVARSDGYRDADSKFTLSNNEDKQLSLPMEWAGGFLSVSALPDGARIHVDGPQSFDGNITDVKSKPGSYSATVSSDGYVTQTRNFQIGVGEHHVEQLQLAIDLVAAKAKADAGDQSSLYMLEQAVSHGEEVVCNVKLSSVDMAVGAYLYDGTVTVSSKGVSFHHTAGDRYKPDFMVMPSKILGLAFENPQPAQDINLRVAIMNRKGKEDKYTYQLYNSGAALVVVSSSGYTNVAQLRCDGCDNSLNVLFDLLQKVRGTN
jgi:hypothetical protein